MAGSDEIPEGMRSHCSAFVACAVFVLTVICSGAAAASPSPGAARERSPWLDSMVPSSFLAASSSFISPTVGWVLGTTGCAAASCTEVLRTSNGGQSWIRIPAPKAVLSAAEPGISELRFANPSDGFAFGGTVLWTTHDKGALWHKLPSVAGIAPYVVSSLVTTPAAAYALVAGNSHPGLGIAGDDGHWRLARAAAGSDRFHVVAILSGSPGLPGGGEPSVAGGAVYSIDGSDLLEVTGSVATTHLLPPGQGCEGPVAASSATDLLLLCGEGVGGGGMGSRELYGSTDSGRTWVRLPDPGPGAGYDNDGVADGGDGHAAIATVSAGGSGLLVTTNYGVRWSLALDFRSNGGVGFADLAYQSPSVGEVVYGPPFINLESAASPHQVPIGGGALYRTADGGTTWSKVLFSSK